MLAKVNDGLNWVILDGLDKRFLLKRPLPIGGWYFTENLGQFYECLGDDSSSWGWEDYHDKENKGAALVAPLNILFWEKE